MMKIATFNINDVNKRLANLIGWLRAEKPDVVALQELNFPAYQSGRELDDELVEQLETWHKAAALARKWQLTQLAGRLEEMARKPVPPGERSSKT